MKLRALPQFEVCTEHRSTPYVALFGPNIWIHSGCYSTCSLPSVNCLIAFLYINPATSSLASSCIIVPPFRTECENQNTRCRPALEISIFTRKGDFLTEDLRTNMMLPKTNASERLLSTVREKREATPIEFYATGAMIDREWTKENFELRHVITRMAVHGFHHLICKTRTYHDPSDSCVCTLCSMKCERYHIELCAKRTKSISEYAKTKISHLSDGVAHSANLCPMSKKELFRVDFQKIIPLSLNYLPLIEALVDMYSTSIIFNLLPTELQRRQVTTIFEIRAEVHVSISG
ncbi:hypothetical protein ANN_05248 [Periplaneta americana]|uniref:Uncharacterized protein n=1 Tax=Periplaneta americana TaxID=6978 RepID=A0ABQ8TAP5_PERAM|nr:hypothetical protein ANN_05248 [Periplaneta americana]